MATYNPKEIEPKWQQYWLEHKTFAARNSSDQEKFFCLVEFPYPSGEGLHVGHPRSYTALDVLARKRRMEGYNVLYPMGYDAFGLPSEQYAIKTGVHPAETTKKNIATFEKQLKSLGFSFDWDRAVTTTDPEYYKWTQWIFVQLYKHGLAYVEEIPVWWCPELGTVLANEEVIDGKSERGGYECVRKPLRQWVIAITKYAERLHADLDLVDYLEQIKIQQRNWIGRSTGAEIDFMVSGNDNDVAVRVFTTRPDTIFGATYLVLAPEHPLIVDGQLTFSNTQEVQAYVEQAKKKSDLERTDLQKDKTGVQLQGVEAINPATGQKIPVWISDYVLVNYGTGAIMAVPGHDQRDWEFATTFNLPIVEVVEGGNIHEAAYTETDEGVLVNSDQFSGMKVEVAKQEITEWIEKRGFGKASVNYKLRDWVFSRQRYWGEPFPIVWTSDADALEKIKQAGGAAAEFLSEKPVTYDKDGTTWYALPIPTDQLPVVLPEVESYQPTEEGRSPLAAQRDWLDIYYNVTTGAVVTRSAGKPDGDDWIEAQREYDTMPNWAGSNWYFMRYTDPHNADAYASQKALEYWMPVDWYNGGMEHTTLHLLYSRFMYKFLYTIGEVPESCGPEPYMKRTSHGMILGHGGEKMSKSRGNVVNPDEVVNEFGADTFRMYEMFMGPFAQAIPWDTQGVKGVQRFLEKVWDLYDQSLSDAESIADKKLETLVHQTIKKVTEDIETQSYNTAVSALMILVNKIQEVGSLDRFTASALARLLAPFAPHIAETLWQDILGQRGSVALAAWPEYQEELTEADEVILVVQINGKVRDKITVGADIMEQKAEQLARQSEVVKRHLQGTTIKNVIYVPGRLINFVVE